MRRVAIIQARTGSTRLPGKVMLDLCGHPMLTRVVNRLQRCRRIDEIVVATTCAPADDAVVHLAGSVGARWFRGSEEDVLSRYLGAATEARADIVVRITSDCPLIDPEVTDQVIAELELNASTCDYASNVITRTYPRGLDTEAMFADTLKRVDRLVQTLPGREHVSWYIYSGRPDLFLIRSVTDTEDNSHLRWTVDESADLELVRRIYSGLQLDQYHVAYRDVLEFVRSHRGLDRANAHISQKKP